MIDEKNFSLLLERLAFEKQGNIFSKFFKEAELKVDFENKLVLDRYLLPYFLLLFFL